MLGLTEGTQETVPEPEGFRGVAGHPREPAGIGLMACKTNLEQQWCLFPFV